MSWILASMLVSDTAGSLAAVVASVVSVFDFGNDAAEGNVLDERAQMLASPSFALELACG